MNGEQIYERIHALMSELHNISRDSFELNLRVAEIQKEIKEIQSNCTHEPNENNVCKFCNMRF